MEKTFALEPREAAMFGQLDQQRTQALAAVGALSLDMEAARKNLEAVADRQRALLQHAVVARGIERFENARMQNGALLVTVPDEVVEDPKMLMDGPPSAVRVHPGKAERPNGPTTDIK
jgi:hypothetical protein